MSARDVFALRDLWSAIDAVEDRIAQRVGVAMILETQRMLEQATRWFLRRRHHYSEIAATVERFAPAVAAMAASLSQWVVGLERSVIEESVRHYQEQGVPTALAAHIAGLDALVCSLDLSEIAPTVGFELMPLATAYFQLGERLELYWLRRQIAKLPAENQWQERARMDLTEQVLEFQKGLTATVLKAYTGTIETGIDIWLDKHRDTVERYRAILAELRSSGAPDLAMLTVALGTIRGVLDVG
jgi:glutamate dehydrogenase